LFTCQYCSSTLEDQTTPEERAAGAYPSLVIHESPEEAFPPIDSSKMGLSSQIKRSTRRIGIIVLLFALLAGAIGVLVALLIV
jgi:hypothetical protein